MAVWVSAIEADEKLCTRVLVEGSLDVLEGLARGGATHLTGNEASVVWSLLFMIRG